MATLFFIPLLYLGNFSIVLIKDNNIRKLARLIFRQIQGYSLSLLDSLLLNQGRRLINKRDYTYNILGLIS